MNHIKIMCECGCGTEAFWLGSGIDYDPSKPGGYGERFESPMCDQAAEYCEECAREQNLPFVKEPLE